MYAIIRAGGHQEKVTPGEIITLDRRKEAVGETVTFTPLMVLKDDGTVVSDRKALGDGDATVVATILQHVKADKIDVNMYRNKTGYRRHIGHRQPVTLLEISEIRFAGEVATAPEPEPEPVAEEAPEAKPKKVAAKKKATKKPAAKKPVAAEIEPEPAAEPEATGEEPGASDTGD